MAANARNFRVAEIKIFLLFIPGNRQGPLGFWMMEVLQIATRSSHNCSILADLDIFGSLSKLLEVIIMIILESNSLVRTLSSFEFSVLATGHLTDGKLVYLKACLKMAGDLMWSQAYANPIYHSRKFLDLP